MNPQKLPISYWASHRLHSRTGPRWIFLSEINVLPPIDVSIELAHNIRSQWVQPIVHPEQVGHRCMVNGQAITIQLACVVIVDVD